MTDHPDPVETRAPERIVAVEGTHINEWCDKDAYPELSMGVDYVRADLVAAIRARSKT